MRINKYRGSKSVPNAEKYNPRQVPADIRVKDLNTLIYHQGVRVKVYQTLFCPNLKSIDGKEHNIDCQVCQGLNFIDLNPIETHAFIQGQSREVLFEANNTGTNFEEQTVLASFIGGIEISYYTRIELVDYAEIYKQLVQRQPFGDIDRLHFKAVKMDAIIDQNGVQYFENTDFVLDRNGDIQWLSELGSKRPSANSIYSVHCRIAVSYRATRAIHCDRFGSNSFKTSDLEVVEFPVQWVLKKAFLFRKEDSESGQRLESNNVFPRGE